MVDRLIHIFERQYADEIVIIVNKLNPLTAKHIREYQATRPAVPIRLIEQTTQSSMHSLGVIAHYLEGAPFCLTTVDTIFREEEFSSYIQHFQNSEADGCMAVTDYIDDESPLYVGTDANLHITGFHDTAQGDRYISGGIYCLRPSALRVLSACLRSGQSRMRNYQRALVESGLRLEACPFSKILDVDHATDIAKAEQFLQS